MEYSLHYAIIKAGICPDEVKDLRYVVFADGTVFVFYGAYGSMRTVFRTTDPVFHIQDTFLPEDVDYVIGTGMLASPHKETFARRMKHSDHMYSTKEALELFENYKIYIT